MPISPLLLEMLPDRDQTFVPRQRMCQRDVNNFPAAFRTDTRRVRLDAWQESVTASRVWRYKCIHDLRLFFAAFNPANPAPTITMWVATLLAALQRLPGGVMQLFRDQRSLLVL